MSPWRILPTVVFYNAVKAKAFLEYVPISLKKKKSFFHARRRWSV